MLGNSHARFLGGWSRATASDYPTTKFAVGTWVLKLAVRRVTTQR